MKLLISALTLIGLEFVVVLSVDNNGQTLKNVTKLANVTNNIDNVSDRLKNGTLLPRTKSPSMIDQKSRQFEEDVLNSHNNYRKLFDLPPLVLNGKLNELACELAEWMAKFKLSDDALVSANITLTKEIIVATNDDQNGTRYMSTFFKDFNSTRMQGNLTSINNNDGQTLVKYLFEDGRKYLYCYDILRNYNSVGFYHKIQPFVQILRNETVSMGVCKIQDQAIGYSTVLIYDNPDATVVDSVRIPHNLIPPSLKDFKILCPNLRDDDPILRLLKGCVQINTVISANETTTLSSQVPSAKTNNGTDNVKRTEEFSEILTNAINDESDNNNYNKNMKMSKSAENIVGQTTRNLRVKYLIGVATNNHRTINSNETKETGNISENNNSSAAISKPIDNNSDRMATGDLASESFGAAKIGEGKIGERFVTTISEIEKRISNNNWTRSTIDNSNGQEITKKFQSKPAAKKGMNNSIDSTLTSETIDNIHNKTSRKLQSKSFDAAEINGEKIGKLFITVSGVGINNLTLRSAIDNREETIRKLQSKPAAKKTINSINSTLIYGIIDNIDNVTSKKLQSESVDAAEINKEKIGKLFNTASGMEKGINSNNSTVGSSIDNTDAEETTKKIESKSIAKKEMINSINSTIIYETIDNIDNVTSKKLQSESFDVAEMNKEKIGKLFTIASGVEKGINSNNSTVRSTIDNTDTEETTKKIESKSVTKKGTINSINLTLIYGTIDNIDKEASGKLLSKSVDAAEINKEKIGKLFTIASGMDKGIKSNKSTARSTVDNTEGEETTKKIESKPAAKKGTNSINSTLIYGTIDKETSRKLQSESFDNAEMNKKKIWKLFTTASGMEKGINSNNSTVRSSIDNTDAEETTKKIESKSIAKKEMINSINSTIIHETIDNIDNVTSKKLQSESFDAAEINEEKIGKLFTIASGVEKGINSNNSTVRSTIDNTDTEETTKKIESKSVTTKKGTINSINLTLIYGTIDNIDKEASGKLLSKSVDAAEINKEKIGKLFTTASGMEKGINSNNSTVRSTVDNVDGEEKTTKLQSKSFAKIGDGKIRERFFITVPEVKKGINSNNSTVRPTVDNNKGEVITEKSEKLKSKSAFKKEINGINSTGTTGNIDNIDKETSRKLQSKYFDAAKISEGKIGQLFLTVSEMEKGINNSTVISIDNGDKETSRDFLSKSKIEIPSNKSKSMYIVKNVTLIIKNVVNGSEPLKMVTTRKPLTRNNASDEKSFNENKFRTALSENIVMHNHQPSDQIDNELLSSGLSKILIIRSSNDLNNNNNDSSLSTVEYVDFLNDLQLSTDRPAEKDGSGFVDRGTNNTVRYIRLPFSNGIFSAVIDKPDYRDVPTNKSKKDFIVGNSTVIIDNDDNRKRVINSTNICDENVLLKLFRLVVHRQTNTIAGIMTNTTVKDDVDRWLGSRKNSTEDNNDDSWKLNENETKLNKDKKKSVSKKKNLTEQNRSYEDQTRSNGNLIDGINNDRNARLRNLTRANHDWKLYRNETELNGGDNQMKHANNRTDNLRLDGDEAETNKKLNWNEPMKNFTNPDRKLYRNETTELNGERNRTKHPNNSTDYRRLYRDWAESNKKFNDNWNERTKNFTRDNPDRKLYRNQTELNGEHNKTKHYHNRTEGHYRRLDGDETKSNKKFNDNWNERTKNFTRDNRDWKLYDDGDKSNQNDDRTKNRNRFYEEENDDWTTGSSKNFSEQNRDSMLEDDEVPNLVDDRRLTNSSENLMETNSTNKTAEKYNIIADNVESIDHGPKKFRQYIGAIENDNLVWTMKENDNKPIRKNVIVPPPDNLIRLNILIKNLGSTGYKVQRPNTGGNIGIGDRRKFFSHGNNYQLTRLGDNWLFECIDCESYSPEDKVHMFDDGSETKSSSLLSSLLLSNKRSSIIDEMKKSSFVKKKELTDADRKRRRTVLFPISNGGRNLVDGYRRKGRLENNAL